MNNLRMLNQFRQQQRGLGSSEPIQHKKIPQIVGLGSLMCSHIFWPVNFNANQLNILVHLQLLCRNNTYQFKVAFRLLPFAVI